jgi:dihydroorotase (multifunctional complex type)
MTQRHDLVIRGGEAVLPGQGVVACDIAVRDGRISAILGAGEACDAAEELSAHGLTILPGVIDAHIHLGHGQDVSRPRVPEDAAVESGAAAAGGITCFVPYLLSTQPYEEVFDEVTTVTAAGSRVDFGYHLVISTEKHLDSIGEYVEQLGVTSFKFFMNTRGGEGARIGLPDIDDGMLYRLCEAAARHGGMVCPHPENMEIAWVLRDRIKALDPDGRGGLASWNGSRPPLVEAEAVQRAALIAHHTGTPLHVVHTSSADAVRSALRHRRDGATIYIETCPHYLTHDLNWAGGDIAKVNPPIRERANCEALWTGLLTGDIDTVATDHIHRDLSAKEGGIWAASPGCPGMETMLPVLISEGHHKRGLSLARITELTAGNPARAMGLDHVKGAIRLGLDADFALIDMASRWRLERSDIKSGSGYSIYEGWDFQGRIVHTMVRGALVLRDGLLDDTHVGSGRYVRRQPRTSHN